MFASNEGLNSTILFTVEIFFFLGSKQISWANNVGPKTKDQISYLTKRLEEKTALWACDSWVEKSSGVRWCCTDWQAFCIYNNNTTLNNFICIYFI